MRGLVLRLESLSRMDRVEGLMKSLKLSEMESKGRKIVWGRREQGGNGGTAGDC